MNGRNLVILVGTLGRDPEVKSFQNGNRVCNLNVATSESWKDKVSGDRKERTEWHRVVIFNDGLVGVAEKYLRKGSKVYLEGQLETRKYEKDGRETHTTEVVLRPYRGELILLDSRDDGRSPHQQDGPRQQSAPRQQSQPAPADPFDDEIPF